MDENKTTNTNPEAGEKTFTQEQVNAIVGERLAKEKTKNEAALVQREQEIAKRELAITARELLNSKGLPVELLDAINCADGETLEKSVSILENVFKTSTEVRNPAPPASGTPPRFDPLRKAMGLE